MAKPVRCAIAAVVRHPIDGRFLAVRRPADDDRLPNVWGLPAVTLRPGELPEDGLRRVGSEKLGTQLQPVRLVGFKSSDRGDYELILMDIEARVGAGEPDVASATTDATRYVAQQWVESVEILRRGAALGSLCCQIMIDAASENRR